VVRHGCVVRGAWRAARPSPVARCSLTRCDAMRCGAMRRSQTRRSTPWCVLYDVVRCSTTRCVVGAGVVRPGPVRSGPVRMVSGWCPDDSPWAADMRSGRHPSRWLGARRRGAGPGGCWATSSATWSLPALPTSPPRTAPAIFSPGQFFAPLPYFLMGYAPLPYFFAGPIFRSPTILLDGPIFRSPTEDRRWLHSATC